MIDFSKARVAVVGDLIEDHWIYGRVDRLSPEGPWPVFVPEKMLKQMGGAANVAANMRALDVTPLAFAPNRVSIKERYVTGRHQLFRVDREDASAISGEEMHTLYVSLKKIIDDLNVVVLSDYGKGCFGGPLAERIITLCNEHGVKTVVDPKGDDWSKYDGATIITPNFAEWKTHRTGGRARLLVTKGEHGMELQGDGISDDRIWINIPAAGPQVVDIVGAGDTVVAALALALGAGYPMEQAARIANAAAGVAVGKPGTSVCTLSELRAAYSDLPAVGIANGCFDILHAGHIELLNAAKARCQKLIIAINSDRSVSRMKGTRRPVNSLATRIHMLSSLRCIDAVCVFDTEEELRQIIEEEGASVIFKGADYKGRGITGDDLPGVRVEIIDTKFKSSTAGELSKVSGVWS